VREEDYWFVNGLAVNEESREIYSSREIEEKALLAKKWFSIAAIAQLNRNIKRKKKARQSV